MQNCMFFNFENLFKSFQILFHLLKLVLLKICIYFNAVQTFLNVVKHNFFKNVENKNAEHYKTRPKPIFWK